MKIEDSFRVPVPVGDAWALLLDIERIAPCMPGAQLEGVDGDEFKGVMKVKVGPITAQYKGTARIAQRDDTAHRAVIEAQGRDTRGQGNASATITAALRADGDATEVQLATELNVTGKVAQFGRGVMADVSGKLLGQFVECLEQRVLRGPSADAEAGTGTAAATETAPIDLLRTAGLPVAKRLLPVLLGGLLVVVVVVLLLLR